jgi:hypothetical protein
MMGRMTGTGTEIIVRGRVEGQGNNRNIEVRNYTLVGKESQPAAVRVRSSNELLTFVTGSRRAWEQMRAEVDNMRSAVNAAEARHAQTHLEGARVAYETEQRAYTEAVARADSLVAEVAAAEASVQSPLPAENPEQVREQRLQQLQPVQRALGAARSDVARSASKLLSLEREVAVAAHNRTQARSRHDFLVAARPFIPDTRTALLARRQILEVPLEILTNPQDRALVGMAARATNENPELLARLANNVRTLWFPQLEQSQARGDATNPARDTAQIDRDHRVIENISSSLEIIGRAMSKIETQWSAHEATLVGELVGYLKDTDIDIEETGARVGDVVILTITNGENDPALRRDYVIRMRVREFGLTPKISESFLLVNRVGVDDLSNEQTLADARTHVNTVRRDTTVRLQSDVRFTPTPSFNFGWTWNQRRCGWDCNGMQKAANLVHWLRPSFGINVAVPQFGTQRVRVQPGTNGGAPTEQIEEIDRGLDLGVGGVFGLFDNTVVVGYGRHLTAERPRDYFALGFSFVKIVQGVIQTAGQ